MLPEADKGLAFAIAKAFLEQGMNVAIAELDSEAGTATAAEFQPLGSIQFTQTDISQEDSVKQAIQATQNQWGRIDVLVRHQLQLTPQDHQQHPAGRVGKPEDIAAFVTGANFVIDGGMTRKMIYS